MRVHFQPLYTIIVSRADSFIAFVFVFCVLEFRAKLVRMRA